MCWAGGDKGEGEGKEVEGVGRIRWRGGRRKRERREKLEGRWSHSVP